MPLVISEKGSQLEPVPAGLHAAVCVALYDVGTQYNEKFDKSSRKAVISWELPELPQISYEKDGKEHQLPRCVSERVTLSLHKKAGLRHMLESWRGRAFTAEELAGFDMEKLVGAPCQVQVIHNTTHQGKTFANVVNVLPAAKGQAAKAETTPTFFSVSDLKDTKLPESLPEWIQKLVTDSDEYAALARGGNMEPAPEPVAAAPVAADDDDVPF